MAADDKKLCVEFKFITVRLLKIDNNFVNPLKLKNNNCSQRVR